MSSVSRLAVVAAMLFASTGLGCDRGQGDETVAPLEDIPESAPVGELADGRPDGGAAFDPQCIPRDLAYWRAARDWPVSSLEIGGRLYSAAEMRAILAMDASTDVSIELMQELIVTWLNFCAGCPVSADVQDAMDDCGRWLEETPDLCMEDGIPELPYCQPDTGPIAESAFACFERLRLYNTNGRVC